VAARIEAWLAIWKLICLWQYTSGPHCGLTTVHRQVQLNVASGRGALINTATLYKAPEKGLCQGTIHCTPAGRLAICGCVQSAAVDHACRGIFLRHCSSKTDREDCLRTDLCHGFISKRPTSALLGRHWPFSEGPCVLRSVYGIPGCPDGIPGLSLGQRADGKWSQAVPYSSYDKCCVS